MNRWVILCLCLVLCNCSTTPTKKGNPMESLYKDGHHVLTVGEDLKPFLNQNVQVIAKVSNTKHPSLGDYWITVMELEDARDKTVHVWGKLVLKTESAMSPEGEIIQGREGDFYHLEGVGYAIVE